MNAAQGRSLWGIILAASLASTIGGLPFNALPVLLGSMADSFALTAAQIGQIGSVCFAGYLLGTLGAPMWLNRFNWRWLTMASAVCAATAFATSAGVRDFWLLNVMWVLIGFFSSTMTCLGLRVLTDMPNKERAFGIRQGVELSVTAAALFALPPLVIAAHGFPGAAMALAVLVLLLGISAWHLPAHPDVAAKPGGSNSPKIPSAAWAALLVFGLFLIGNIGLWAFLERIGAALKITPAEMGLVFAVLKLLGGVAAFCVAGLGERWRISTGCWITLAGLCVGLALLASASGFAAYALGAWIWEFAFTCGCIFQTAHIARCDPSGRAIVLVPASFALASMIGPSVAGYLMGAGGSAWLLTLALASSIIPAQAYSLRKPG